MYARVQSSIKCSHATTAWWAEQGSCEPISELRARSREREIGSQSSWKKCVNPGVIFGPFGVIVGHFGSFLGHFGSFWVILGPLWIILGHSRAILGHFGPFGVIFGPLWAIWGNFGPFLGHFVAFLDKFAESSIFLRDCWGHDPRF